MADGEIPEMILVMQKCSGKQDTQIPEKIFRKYRVMPREDAQTVIRKEKLYEKMPEISNREAAPDWTFRRHVLVKLLKEMFR